ncbi:hypothetical protein QEO94_02930 [Kingella negevensis]|uniref:hypothetical protein n=1 Tax=Kingella negevensis TaxID=1522312 RepID=UPI0025432F50|nr:hypothetical protein [Kingella negevensis]WII93790.1 hypothetical protein QEO94_02930 [Kingella negevensis]
MKTMKHFLLVLMLYTTTVYAAPTMSDSERIAVLERQVARLTEQVNQLLVERLGQSLHAQTVHVCSIQAFTDTYRAENVNLGRARLAALQQCRKNHNAMFCEDSAVQCKTY